MFSVLTLDDRIFYFKSASTIRQLFEVLSPSNFNGPFPLVLGNSLIFEVLGT
jgi:hypothetical protein